MIPEKIDLIRAAESVKTAITFFQSRVVPALRSGDDEQTIREMQRFVLKLDAAQNRLKDVPWPSEYFIKPKASEIQETFETWQGWQRSTFDSFTTMMACLHLLCGNLSGLDGIGGPRQYRRNLIPHYREFWTSSAALGAASDVCFACDALKVLASSNLNRDEFTEESRTSGHWAIICGWEGERVTFRNKKKRGDIRVHPDPANKQRYFIHIDDLPQQMRAKVARDKAIRESGKPGRGGSRKVKA